MFRCRAGAKPTTIKPNALTTEPVVAKWAQVDYVILSSATITKTPSFPKVSTNECNASCACRKLSFGVYIHNCDLKMPTAKIFIFIHSRYVLFSGLWADSVTEVS